MVGVGGGGVGVVRKFMWLTRGGGSESSRSILKNDLYMLVLPLDNTDFAPSSSLKMFLPVDIAPFLRQFFIYN